MKHGSLFNGIGGFQLAAAWMGWTNLFSCEIDDFCNKVTKKHFPDCIQHGDIKTTDFTVYRGRINVLSGGFPCQPFSDAGNRKGTEDERYLWGEMLRAIREVQPSYVVGENVRGLTTWNRGMVFDQVQADLETEGFEVLPFLLPACGKNALHKRDRIWFVAHSKSERFIQDNIQSGEQLKMHVWKRSEFSQSLLAEKIQEAPDARDYRIIDGLSIGVDRIKALGNAIVPQIAFEIFKAIEQTQRLNSLAQERK